MCKYRCLVLLFVFLSFNSFGETTVAQNYLQRFIMADMTGKIEILQNVFSNRAELKQTQAAVLYKHSLRFVLDNFLSFDDLNDMNTISGIAIQGLVHENRVGEIDVFYVLNLLWELFNGYPEPEIKAEIAVALGYIGRGNRVLIDSLNSYLKNKNDSFRAGETVDYIVVSAIISALMELGDSTSYPALFSIISSNYPEVIVSEALGALEIIPGDLSRFLLNAIETYPPNEKFSAFRIATSSDRFSVSERGLLAEAALTQGLLSPINEGNADLDAMRYAAVLELTRLRWTRANTLAIRHFHRVQADLLQNNVPKGRLLEAIACLGAVGNSDAAFILGLQLDLINLEMRASGFYNPEITLAVVKALGLIGDNAVFGKLQTVINLPFTDNIVAAAKEAADRLRW
ncbi:MAG: HEAT repeat domain-containing protein [Treponema sp.]|nr:HEAT repeat domain-containing protein [Treponema sp.]